MSDLDDRLRRSLEADAQTWRPDLARNRADVRRKAARLRLRRRRIGLAAVAVGALAAVALVFGVVGPGLVRGSTPVPPTERPGGTTGPVPLPFRLAARYDARAMGLHHPLDLAASPNGDLYVTDLRQTVTELTPTGRVVRRWGRAGTGPGEFRMYSGGIDVGRDGRVYVADTGNFRVQVFSPAGRFIEQVGSFGRGPGQFVWPTDVVAAGDGSMYVADDRAETVTKLAASGRQLWRIGDSATSDRDLLGHEHLGDIDGRGRLVMANDDAGRVVYLAPNGRKVAAFGSYASGSNGNGAVPSGGDFPGGACGATTDARGDVYVDSCQESSSAQHNTEVFDADHHLIAAWPRGPLIGSPSFAPDGQALGLTSTGSLLVLDVRLR